MCESEEDDTFGYIFKWAQYISVFVVRVELGELGELSRAAPRVEERGALVAPRVLLVARASEAEEVV